MTVRAQLKGGGSKEKELPEGAAVALRAWLALSPQVMTGPVFLGPRREGD